MKIIERIASPTPYEFFEIHYESLEEFQKMHAKAKDTIRDKLPAPEPIPTCSICKKKMMRSSKGRFYCKHSKFINPSARNGEIVWGDAVFPEKEPTEKEKEFLEELNN